MEKDKEKKPDEIKNDDPKVIVVNMTLTMSGKGGMKK